VKRSTDADKTSKIKVKNGEINIFFINGYRSNGNSSSRPDKKQTNRVALPAAAEVIYYYNISVGRLLGI